jgi:hypothetical protein
VKPAGVASQCWPAALSAQLDDAAGQNVAGAGVAEMQFDGRAGSAGERDDENLWVSREIVDKAYALGSQREDLRSRELGHKQREALGAGHGDPGLDGDSALGPGRERTRVKNLASDRHLAGWDVRLVQDASATRWVRAISASPGHAQPWLA